MRSTTISRMAGVAALLVATAGLAPSPASAIPAFARKYETSCQTCHIAYPKLNTFGQAFRLLGYRMPGETEEQVKQAPVRLGSDAYKRVWPDAVWPSTIPSHVPLAVTGEFQVKNDDASDADFRFPSEVTLVAAGTAGDTVSYFGELGFEKSVEDGQTVDETGVEHFDFRFIRPFNHSSAFNVKIGAFQPELVQTFDHARRLTVENYAPMFGVNTLQPEGAISVGGADHHGGGGIALPAVATGIEGYGIVHHRFFWTAGVANGIGPGEDTFDGNNAKDVYGRVAYKWGGMTLDGSNADQVQQAKNWRERSLEVGVFGYDGDGGGVLAAAGHHEHDAEMPAEEPAELAFVSDDQFTRYGVDVNAFYDDFNLFGAYYTADDDIRTFGADAMGAPLPVGDLDRVSFDAFFLELDAVLGYPWLHGAVRYENVDLPAPAAHHDEAEGTDDHGEEEAQDAGGGTFERGVVSLTALVRANVKTTLEYVWNLNDSTDDTLWLNFGLAF